MNRLKISIILNISNGHLSDIFNEIKPPGRRTCEKFSSVVPGSHWTDFAKMTGPEIEDVLKKHLSEKHEGDDEDAGIDRRDGDDRRAKQSRPSIPLQARRHAERREEDRRSGERRETISLR